MSLLQEIAVTAALTTGARIRYDDASSKAREMCRGDPPGPPSDQPRQPQIVAQGIADESELGLDTLQMRIASRSTPSAP
jgi:hypothetical protein